jgi:hypothetical protein
MVAGAAGRAIGAGGWWLAARGPLTGRRFQTPAPDPQTHLPSLQIPLILSALFATEQSKCLHILYIIGCYSSGNIQKQQNADSGKLAASKRSGTMFKKVVLVVVVSFMALVFLALAVAGVAAAAGLATAAAVISDSGVVQAFEEVADGADRLEISVDENSITFTNPDSGQSRTVTAEEPFGHGRVQFDLSGLTVTGSDGETVVVSPVGSINGEVRLPEITITNPDNGESRVIVPSAERFDNNFRVPRITWDGRDYGALTGLRILGQFVRGLFTLALLLVVAVIAYALLRNRSRHEEKVDAIKGEDLS